MGQGEGKLLKRSLVEDQVARVSHTPLPVLKLSVWAKTTRVIREGQRIVVRGTLASIATTFWSPDCTTVHKILHVLNCMVFVVQFEQTTLLTQMPTCCFLAVLLANVALADDE